MYSQDFDFIDIMAMTGNIKDPFFYIMAKRMMKKNNIKDVDAKVEIIKDIKEKELILETAKMKLKKKYIGINDVIDKIIASIKMFYLYPEYQTRPTIVNLYGLTGTGKTSLVKDLAKCLGLSDKFCAIELDSTTRMNRNSWGSDQAGSIMKRIMELNIRPQDQSILLLDEVHRFRTLDLNPDSTSAQKLIPVKNRNYSDVWSLLSDGTLYSDAIILSWIRDYIERLQDIYQRYELNSINNNKLSFNDKLSSLFGYEASHDDDDDGKSAAFMSAINRNQNNKNDFNKGVYNIVPVQELLTYVQITKDDCFVLNRLRYTYQPESATLYDFTNILNEKEFKGIDKILQSCSNRVMLEFLKIKYDELVKKQQSDISIEDDDNERYIFKKMLIFICGNLEDLYLKNEAEKITTNDVIIKLKEFFRPEQIARFGKNYIVYPVFTEKNFQDIIEKEIIRKENMIKREYDIDIRFDKNEIWNTVKSRGIDLKSGTRPLYSSLGQIFSEIIPNMLIEKKSQETILEYVVPVNEKPIEKNNNINAEDIEVIEVKEKTDIED
jgi:cell division protease FtsH